MTGTARNFLIFWVVTAAACAGTLEAPPEDSTPDGRTGPEIVSELHRIEKSISDDSAESDIARELHRLEESIEDGPQTDIADELHRIEESIPAARPETAIAVHRLEESIAAGRAESEAAQSDPPFADHDHVEMTGVRLSHVRYPAPLDARIHLAELDPKLYEVRVEGISKKNPAGTSVLGALTRLGANVVLGSGFVSTLSPPTPVGLLIVDGSVVNPINRVGLSGIIAVSDRGLEITRREDFDRRGVSGALQVGPILVERNQNVVEPTEPTRRPAATRSFLGLRSDGTVLVGITTEGVHLYDLADLLMRRVEDGGLGCEIAVNLAGGGSEGLATGPMGRAEDYGNERARQAAVLAFTNKAKNRVEEIISRQLGVAANRLKPDVSMFTDLGADPLDAVELILAFEQAFNIRIPDGEAEEMRTVGDAIRLVSEQVRKQ